MINFRPKRYGRPPGQNFPEGKTKITYTAKDRAGNSASCTVTVHVTGREFYYQHKIFYLSNRMTK